jgi:hypothetical protein
VEEIDAAGLIKLVYNYPVIPIDNLGSLTSDAYKVDFL